MHLTHFKLLDPIHGFIRFDALEHKLITTPFFQRLRYIRQMGVTYLIYPGTTHTRFEHSLGVMELAGRIFDTLVAKEHQIVDLGLSSEQLAYWRKIVRLSALCHDMGHLPFSHTAEQKVLGSKGHEKMLITMLQSDAFSFITEELGSSALADILKLSIEEDLLPTKRSPIEALFAKIITGDNFGADRIDYLIRDAKYTGVGYGHFDYHQLIDTLRILPDGDGYTLGITASGIQSVESLWIARYLMHARVYKHPKSCAYSSHMQRYMAELPFSLELTEYVRQTDYTILEGMQESENEDAKVILNKEEPYRPLVLTEAKQDLVVERQKEIEALFGPKVMIEKRNKGKGSRDFLIYEGQGSFHSSAEYSEFLKRIPLGIKSAQLFAHPESYQEVMRYLQEQA